MAPIDLYTNPISAPGRMVLLLAKHLDVALNVRNIDLMKGEQLKPEFIKINPQHTIPTMVDDGFVLTESRAMLMYLQNKYGKDDTLYPKDPQKRAMVDMRLFFDISSLYLKFGEAYYPVMFLKQSLDPAKIEKFNEALGYTNTFLKDGYIAGSNLTIADFSMGAIVSTFEAVGHDLSKYPNIVAFLEKCRTTMKGWNELNQVGCDAFGEFFKNATGN